MCTAADGVAQRQRCAAGNACGTPSTAPASASAASAAASRAHRCADGGCVTAARVPATAHVRRPDAETRADGGRAAAAVRGGCRAAGLLACEDGCARVCATYDGCPLAAPVRCPDALCYPISPPSAAACAAGEVACADGYGRLEAAATCAAPLAPRSLPFVARPTDAGVASYIGVASTVGDGLGTIVLPGSGGGELRVSGVADSVLAAQLLPGGVSAVTTTAPAGLASAALNLTADRAIVVTVTLDADLPTGASTDSSQLCVASLSSAADARVEVVEWRYLSASSTAQAMRTALGWRLAPLWREARVGSDRRQRVADAARLAAAAPANRPRRPATRAQLRAQAPRAAVSAT